MDNRIKEEKHMKKMDAIITIKPLKINTMNVRIIGDSPLIMHKWLARSVNSLIQ